MKARSYALISFALMILICAPGIARNASRTRTSRNLKLTADNHYVVRRGDNLTKIARAFKTTPAALSSANNLRNDRIQIGQRLAIPVAEPVDRVIEKPKPAAVETRISAAPVWKEEAVEADEEKPARYRLVEAGFKLLGVRYRRGGSGTSGFDCSGLVKSLFSKFDIELPRSSREQYLQGEKVERDQLEIGDLVFFSSGGKQPTHVGIYVGDNKFLHAALKAKRVIVSDLNKVWYTMRYLGARRVSSLWGDETAQTAQE